MDRTRQAVPTLSLILSFPLQNGDLFSAFFLFARSHPIPRGDRPNGYGLLRSLSVYLRRLCNEHTGCQDNLLKKVTPL